MKQDFSSLFSGGNAPFITALYDQYLHNKDSVAAEWAEFFGQIPDTAKPSSPPLQNGVAKNGGGANATITHPTASPALSDKNFKENVSDSLRAIALIRAFRIRGHFMCTLDPLGITRRARTPNLTPNIMVSANRIMTARLNSSKLWGLNGQAFVKLSKNYAVVIRARLASNLCISKTPNKKTGFNPVWRMNPSIKSAPIPPRNLRFMMVW